MSIRTGYDISFNGNQLAKLAEQLGGLAGISFTGPVRKTANVFLRDWRRRLPKPGYPGDVTQEKSLLASMRAKVKHVPQRNTYYAVIGSDVSTGAHHSHLVEEPHRIVSHGQDTGKRTRGGHYGDAAYEATKQECGDTMLAEVTKLVRKQMGAP